MTGCKVMVTKCGAAVPAASGRDGCLQRPVAQGGAQDLSRPAQREAGIRVPEC